MDVRLTDDAGEFAVFAHPFFRSEPFTSNVIAVEVDGVESGRRTMREDSLWVMVDEGGRAVGVAMHTPPFNLFLPRLGDGVAEAVADALFAAGRRLPGVGGEVGTAERFLARWHELGGPSAHKQVSERMYVLGTLRTPVGVPGRGRVADAGDEAHVAQWLAAFHDEAMPEAPVDDFGAMARRRIAQGHFWVWERDGHVVSLAGASPPAVGVARVGPVYTPPHARRRGYGAAVTAAATQAATEAGAADVVLYTDLSNPTSNAIYRAIGYVPHHDSGRWGFTD
jgi:predicted GNAT family acetyltransferase